MRSFPYADHPLLARAGLAVAALACLWLLWSAEVRVGRVRALAELPGRALAADQPDARSATGRPDGQREMIVAERDEESFDWIAQAQAMLAGGPARVRWVDYDNAPHGRPVSAASPYRWWLGLVATVDHAATGRPLGLGVERAAVLGDPLLQAVMLLALAGFAGWAFGGLAAGLLAVGWVALFPLASGFLPGMPDARGLSLGLALASLLLVAAGLRPADRPRRMLWGAAGTVTGLGFWVGAGFEGPLVLGLLLAAATLPRGAPAGGNAGSWRIWGLAAGVTVLLGYAAEYFPAHLGDLDLTVVHPAYGVALVGSGDLLALLGEPPAAGAPRGRWIARLAAAGAAVLLLPALMLKAGSAGFLSKDLLWAQLSRLPDCIPEPSTFGWLGHSGWSLPAAAALLPLLAALTLALAALRAGAGAERYRLLVLLGPVAAAVVLALGRLEWWSLAEVAILGAATAALGAAPRRLGPAAWLAAAAGVGFAVLWPSAAATPTPREAEELVDRHLAHWLARRSGQPGTVVLAPPHVSAALDFFGGLRGLGSFAPDNHAGFEAELNIAVARTMEEIQQDLEARQVRYLVIPSWDPFFEECGRRYLGPAYARRTFLVDALRHWQLPAWLRPIPYQAPVGGGAAVLVFEVVPDQAPALAAARLTEYLVETGRLAEAAAAADDLRRYPGDVGALAARAEVADAVGNAAGFAQAAEALLARLANGGDRYLPWDRRVGLTVVLAQSDHVPEARAQLGRCLAEATEVRLRGLSTGSLFALLRLSQLLQVDFPAAGLRQTALGLLPGDLRDRL